MDLITFFLPIATLVDGMGYIGIGLAVLSMAGVSIAEGMIGYKTIESMARNPEMYGKLRTAMIIACGIVETCAIYALLAVILILFI